MTRQLLTVSRLRTWRRCQQLHHLRYHEGYRRVQRDEVLHLGSLVDAGLQAWWRALGDGIRGDDLYGWALSVVGAEADPFVAARATAMLAGYHFRWEDAADEWEVIAVQPEFRAPLINPATGGRSLTFDQGGKLDVLARWRSRVVIVEHKTSSEDIGSGSSYWQRLKLDAQISTYFGGAVALGHPAEAVIYDVLGKPKLDPLRATPPDKRRYRKSDGALDARQRDRDETPDEFHARLVDAIAEAPERYYQRGEVVRLEDELARHQGDVWAQALAIRHAQRFGLHALNPESCMAYGRPCPMLLACSGEGSLDDPALYERTDNPHPELTDNGRSAP